LTAALESLDNDAIKGFLSNKGCDWIKFTMNVPSASHMGGAWERLIRTVRSVLSTLLFNHGTQLDDESLRTLMTEAESVVNNRPLTVFNLRLYETRPLQSQEMEKSTIFDQSVLAKMAKRIQQHATVRKKKVDTSAQE
jgi:hypothetical protein